MKRTKIISIILAAVMLFSIIPAATLTAYAVDTHTVKFDGNGHGGTLLELPVPEGQNIYDALREFPDENAWNYIFPNELLRENGHAYRLFNWYSDPACNEDDWYSFGNYITEDITIYAKWLQCLESVDVTLTVPKCGETTEIPNYPDGNWWWDDQTNRPRYIDPDSVFDVSSMEVDEETGELVGKWVISKDDIDTPFVGKFEGGKEYSAYLYPYFLDTPVYEDTQIIVNGGSIPVELTEVRFNNYAARVVVKVKVEHDWGEWTVVKEPTKTETGLRERVCKGCGEKETEVIPALGGDTPEASKPATPPTGDSSYITVCLASLAFASALMAAAFVMRSRKAK